MKKQALTVILSALLLTGCAQKQNDSRADHTPSDSTLIAGEENSPMPEALKVPGITVQTELPLYPPNVQEIRLHVKNGNDENFSLPQDFKLMYIVEEGYSYRSEYLPYRENGDSFTAEGQEIPANGEADIVLDIAGHFDLPLADDSGFYRVEIGRISADFDVFAGSIPQASQQSSQDGILMETEQESYPADTKEINVRFINDGTKDFSCTVGEFALEQFGGDFVSMTEFIGDSSEAQKTVKLSPGDCEMVTLRLSDFTDDALQPGEYALFLNGLEARFTIT